MPDLSEEITLLLEHFDRERFIALRTALIARGIADPVLMRFDSHTVPPADEAAVKEQLLALAARLRA